MCAPKISLRQYFVHLYKTHYDNINGIPNPEVELHLDMYYTDKLRPNEAGIMIIGHGVPASASILIPPNTPAERILGHCGSGCTDLMFPDEGINLFMMNMHTHLAGRQTRVRHFRGNVEQPWLNSDNNYNVNYQESRLLKSEVKLQKGDHLMIRKIFKISTYHVLIEVFHETF